LELQGGGVLDDYIIAPEKCSPVCLATDDSRVSWLLRYWTRIYIHIKIHQAVFIRRRHRDTAAEGRVLTNAKHACLHDSPRAHITIICACVHTRRAHDRDTCTFYIEINTTARGRRYTSSGYKRPARRLDEEGDGGGGGCVH